MRTHRVAVVGCGALAQSTHLPHAKANPRIQLVATGDLDPRVAKRCQLAFGAERSENDWRKVVRAFVEGSPRGNCTIVLRFSDGSITIMHHSMVDNFDYPKELIEASLRHITIAMDRHFELRQCGLGDELNQRFFPYATESSWASRPGMSGYLEEVAAEQKRASNAAEPARWLTVNNGHAEHLDRFLTHLERRGENPCDVESAVAVNRIALKLLESARLGMPVAINPEDWHLPQA